MASSDSPHNPKGPRGSLKRPRFGLGDYLASNDLAIQQQYYLQRRRRHNRYLHGNGIICGLWVVPVDDTARPWAVQVCPGLAIDCCGDKIEVTAPTTVDIRDYLWRLPHGDTGQGRAAYAAIRYAEQQEQPVPVRSQACRCETTSTQPSRIGDSYQVDIVWELSPVGNGESIDLCRQQSASCPQCPASLFIFLAEISLPASESDPISRDHIDSGIFRP